MGLFDNFIKQIDQGLKAVESGALEKRLDDIAGAIDRTSKQASTTIKSVADKPQAVLQKMDLKKDTIEQKAKVVRREAGKHMDIVRRKY